MKILGPFATSMTALLLVTGHTSATEIDLATGLDSAGSLQTTGDALDVNWQVTGAVNPLDPPNAYVVGNTSADSGYPSWPTNGPNSSWIAANPDDPRGNGLMTFTRTFEVSDPSSAAIDYGSWAIDDQGALSLNGNVLAILGNRGSPAWALFPFATIPSDFVVGLNSLTIEITTTDYWVEGARFQGKFVDGGSVATPYPEGPQTPEPSTWAMMLLGLAGLSYAGYRRARAGRGTLAA